MRRIVFALLIAQLFSSAAFAGSRLAGPLVGTAHRCCALNVSDRFLAVTARIRDESGADITSTDLCERNAPLAPGNACCAQSFSDFPSAATCVIGADAAKGTFRGSLAAEEGVGSPTAVLEAK